MTMLNNPLQDLPTGQIITLLTKGGNIDGQALMDTLDGDLNALANEPASTEGTKIDLLSELLRRAAAPPPKRQDATHANIARILRPYAADAQEHFFVITLDGKLPTPAIIGVYLVYKGARSSVIISPPDVLRPAIRDGATRIILAHTHPTDQACQSIDDVQATNALVELAGMMELHIMDHIIVSRQGFFSMAQQGAMRKTETTVAYNGNGKETGKYEEAMFLAIGITDVEEIELTETQLRSYPPVELYQWLLRWGYTWDVPLQAWIKEAEGRPRNNAPF
jgi:DNA repair protein RadC